MILPIMRFAETHRTGFLHFVTREDIPVLFIFPTAGIHVHFFFHVASYSCTKTVKRLKVLDLILSAELTPFEFLQRIELDNKLISSLSIANGFMSEYGRFAFFWIPFNLNFYRLRGFSRRIIAEFNSVKLWRNG